MPTSRSAAARPSLRRPRLAAGLLVAVIAAAALGGCHAGPRWGRYNEIRTNLTPELMTLDRRQVDVDRGLVILTNANGRMIWEDIGRFWLLNRPSRLSPVPIPY